MDYIAREEEINNLYVIIKKMEVDLEKNSENSELQFKIQGLSKRLLELENKDADDYDEELKKRLKLPFSGGKKTIEGADELLRKYEKLPKLPKK